MIRKLVVVLLTGVMCLVGITSALAVKYNEAPMLKTMVAAGELPPVEQRLPEEPLVLEPLEEIGQYGGAAYVLTMGGHGIEDGFNMIGMETVLGLTPDLTTIIPSLAKNWEFSEGGKTFTLYLRKGIKWSDGVPFTADDIMFWWEDIMLNKELTPVIMSDWILGGEPMVVEKLDDYTLRFDFAVPYPSMALKIAHGRSYMGWFYAPAHYVKQFHPRYTPIEELNETAEREGYMDWMKLFQAKGAWSSENPDLPTVYAFALKEVRVDHRVFERNPYYWKVDTAGNQLPYIDQIVVSLVPSIEVYNGKIISGEVDYAAHNTKFGNYPLLKENEEKGNYRVLIYKRTTMGEMNIQVNQTVKDPVLRKMFRDKRFRIALSLAINREEINNILYGGLAMPTQVTVVPGSKYFEPEFAEAYAEYDPEEANRLLDEMGLKWDENHQYRLRPDGKPLLFTLQYWEAETSKRDNLELVKEHWTKIGIGVSLKEVTGSYISTFHTSNEVEIGVWHADGVTDITFPLWPGHFIPCLAAWSNAWSPLWAQWYVSGGKGGEEPTPEVMKNIELWERMISTLDEEERISLGKEILRSQAENLWTFGTVGVAPHPIVVNKNLRNVPETGLFGWDTLWMDAYSPEQFFFRQE